ncbi:MAG: type II secretion system F family protein [Phycisphaeraceae bacterium]|nr:type II secretion system F family protein [Phycisphaeraceae bacterium]
MATFAYRTASDRGAGGLGGATIEAPDRATAVRELMRRGVTPTAVEQVAESGGAGGGAAVGGGGAAVRGGAWGAAMTRVEMAAFIRELATALQAGLPLVQALKTIAKQGRSQRQKAMLSHVIEQVEHGRSLADAASSWGKPFTDLTVNLMRSGEAAGRLPEVLAQAADLLDRDVKLRRSLLGATLYPMILAGLVCIAVVVIVTFIVPNVLKSLPKGAELPLPTRIVQGAAGFVATYWWLVLLMAAGALWGWTKLYAMPEFRMSFDRGLLKSPVLGRLLRDVAVARFTRTLGTLTAAGVPILQALRITKGTLGNRAMERVVDEVCEQVASGRTIADPMERSGYFPPMLVQIVNLGERSGRLDEMLAQAAGAFEEKTETSVKLFTTALPPILVVGLAVVVGFVVLSILLPLLQAQEALK